MNFFFILILVAMASAAAALIVGLIGMVKGGEFNEKYGNKLMRWRVILQGVALVFMAAAIMSSKA